MHYQAVLLPEKNGALGRNRTHNLLIRSQALYPVELLAHINGAQGRSRTGTDFKVRRILSPVRLPVPPPRHFIYFKARAYFLKWCPAEDSNL